MSPGLCQVETMQGFWGVRVSVLPFFLAVSLGCWWAGKEMLCWCLALCLCEQDAQLWSFQRSKELWKPSRNQKLKCFDFLISIAEPDTPFSPVHCVDSQFWSLVASKDLGPRGGSLETSLLRGDLFCQHHVPQLSSAGRLAPSHGRLSGGLWTLDVFQD